MDEEDQLEFECSSSSTTSDTIVIKNTNQEKSTNYNPILSAYIPLISDKDIYDFDLNTLEEKPWLKPGADIEDYFNYGFDETSWRMYCAKQRALRNENLQTVRLVSEKVSYMSQRSSHFINDRSSIQDSKSSSRTERISPIHKSQEPKRYHEDPYNKSHRDRIHESNRKKYDMGCQAQDDRFRNNEAGYRRNEYESKHRKYDDRDSRKNLDPESYRYDYDKKHNYDQYDIRSQNEYVGKDKYNMRSQNDRRNEYDNNDKYERRDRKFRRNDYDRRDDYERKDDYERRSDRDIRNRDSQKKN